LGGTLLLVFVVAEVGLRLAYGEGIPGFQGKLKPKPPEGLKEIKNFFDLARPHTRGLVGGAPFYNNSAGFRGPDRQLAKDPGVHRTVVVGDSFVMGDGVTFEETYSHQLQGLLATSGLAGPNAEVLNLGVSGLNAPAVVNRLAALGVRYHPNVVVYGYTLNDVEGPKYRRSHDGSYTNPRRFHSSSLYLVRMLGPKALSFADLLIAPVGSYTNELDENYFRNPDTLGMVRDSLARFVSLSREHGFCPVLFVHTRLSTLTLIHAYRRHYRFVEELAQEAGAHVVQSIDGFMGRADMSLWAGYYNQHPNGAAHGILAKSLHDGLAQLPASCLASGK
jgi:lysophospholipase L1-like esterase